VENKYLAIRLHENDNVAVALTNIKSGETVLIQGYAESVKALKGIPYGHKIALKDIAADEWVIKYGEYMGVATEHILQGARVHVSNVRGLNVEERSAIVDKRTNQPVKESGAVF
jgi:altronate dehydratase